LRVPSSQEPVQLMCRKHICEGSHSRRGNWYRVLTGATTRNAQWTYCSAP
jgi:hypothetical protein